MPAPAPPPPAAVRVFDGDTTGAFWYPYKGARLPQFFVLRFDARENVLLLDGGAPFPVLLHCSFPQCGARPGDEAFETGSRDEMLSLLREAGSWTWTYNGLAGQAWGTLKER
jgi:hypothetical protein